MATIAFSSDGVVIADPPACCPWTGAALTTRATNTTADCFMVSPSSATRRSPSSIDHALRGLGIPRPLHLDPRRRGVDLAEIVGRQLDVSRAQVLLEARHHLRRQAGAGARGLVRPVPRLLSLLPEPTTAAGRAFSVDQDASLAEVDSRHGVETMYHASDPPGLPVSRTITSPSASACASGDERRLQACKDAQSVWRWRRAPATRSWEPRACGRLARGFPSALCRSRP
jgi:hypothetical protein